MTFAILVMGAMALGSLSASAAEDAFVPPPKDDRVTQAAVRLPGGDWLVYEGDFTFSNSPIMVQRVGPRMTGTKWTATLQPGEVRQRVSRGLGRKVFVHVGRGQSEGTVEFDVQAKTAGFRETLDLATGKFLKRDEPKE